MRSLFIFKLTIFENLWAVKEQPLSHNIFYLIQFYVTILKNFESRINRNVKT